MREVPCFVPESDRIGFALALVTALAGAGRLQGRPELGHPDTRSFPQVALYYVEDASVDTLLDRKVAMSRIRSATTGNGRHATIRRSASFNWVDQDVRARYFHHFMVQPWNALVTVEGVLSHEEVRLRAPIPLWGGICFHAGKGSWQDDFERQNYATADAVLGQAVTNIRSALHPMAATFRRRAVRKIERHMERIQLRLLDDKDQA